MTKYSNITDFIKKDYLEYLLKQNITIVHFTLGKTLTFLVYKDEFFIFDSERSLNKAYIFYNVEKNLCDEGIDYYKISKDYLNYMNKDNPNIQNGSTFKIKKHEYLINYFSKGYTNNKKMSLSTINRKMHYILEFCDNISKEPIEYTSFEKTAIIQIKNKIEYIVDFYQVDAIEPNHITNKFKKDDFLINSMQNKVLTKKHARIGIFFCDGYKDCIQLEEFRTGGFLYYSLDDDYLQVHKFQKITLNEIYFLFGEMFDETLPLSITTDSDFLYDVLHKSLKNNVDFILDKTNYYNRFIKEFGVALVLHNFDLYKIDAFCLLIQNNFDEYSKQFKTISVSEYEYLLNGCIETYTTNLEDDFDFYDTSLDEEEIEETEENIVDTKLFS